MSENDQNELTSIEIVNTVMRLQKAGVSDEIIIDHLLMQSLGLQECLFNAAKQNPDLLAGKTLFTAAQKLKDEIQQICEDLK